MKEEVLFVGYLRVSTPRQGESGLGVEDQRRTMIDMAASRGGRIIKWFEEHKTATKKRIRIIQNEARAFCKEHGAIFLAARLDRFARDYDFCKDLFGSGDPFLFCDCPSANSLELKIRAVFAEEEAIKISDNTRKALAVLKSRGVKLGNPKNFSNAGRAEGNMTLKLQSLKNAENLKTIAFIKEMRINKRTYQQIADILNESGYTTITGKSFNKGAVYNLVKFYERNEAYLRIA